MTIAVHDVAEQARGILDSHGDPDSLSRADRFLESVADRSRRYFDIPERARALWAESGDAGFGWLVLARAIAEAPARLARVPPSIVPDFLVEYRRMLETADRRLDDDVYQKDLALALAQAFPGGALIAEPHSGLSRRFVSSGGPAQVVRFLALALRARGRFRPYVELHVHPPMIDRFHPEGWERCYHAVAAWLEANPPVLGLIATSWFYDPAVIDISPRLAYLQQLPRGHGAVLLRAGSTDQDVRNATAKSATRRRLYEEGKYMPTSYALVWPRERLLRWAGR